MIKYPNRIKNPDAKLDYLAAAHDLISKLSSGRGEAILTTNDEHGRPHATWMNTVNACSLINVITLTSPDSRKVQNLLLNPQVEWMLSDENKHQIVYMRGEAEVVHDPHRVLEILKSAGELSKEAYFLQYRTTGMDFLAIETHINEVELCIPEENVFNCYDLDQILNYLNALEENEVA